MAPQRREDSERIGGHPREEHGYAGHDDGPEEPLADDGRDWAVREEAVTEVEARDDAADPAEVLLREGLVEAELRVDAHDGLWPHAGVLQVAVRERTGRRLDDDEADDRH